MFYQFMRRRKHLCVRFVTRLVLEKVDEPSMFHQLMRKKTFKCEICNYSCTQKEYIITYVHKRWSNLYLRFVTTLHKKNKPFKICDSSCSQRGSMIHHVIAVHEKKMPEFLSCFSCFSQKYKMNIHVASVHESKKHYHCDICD